MTRQRRSGCSRCGCWLVGAVATLGIGVCLAWMLWPSSPAAPKIVSFNLDNFTGDPQQTALLGEDLRRLDANVIAVQEAQGKENLLQLARSALPGSWSAVTPSCGPSMTVGLLYDSGRYELVGDACHDAVQVGRPNLRPALEVMLRDQDASTLRLFVAHLKADGQSHRTRQDQLRALRAVVARSRQPGDTVVVLGDFNIDGQPDRKALWTLAHELDLDWSTEDIECTFVGYAPNCRCMALDHVLSSTPTGSVEVGGVCADATPRCGEKGSQGSDHCPIAVRLE